MPGKRLSLVAAGDLLHFIFRDGHVVKVLGEGRFALSSYFVCRDQARGRLGRNSRPRGRNFALIVTQGEVGVSLKKKKKKKFFFFFFFFRETHFHSVTTQMQAVVTL